jgi:hypothetical protein
MVVAHIGHEVPNLEDCLACHPTGRETAKTPDVIGSMFENIGNGNH